MTIRARINRIQPLILRSKPHLWLDTLLLLRANSSCPRQKSNSSSCQHQTNKHHKWINQWINQWINSKAIVASLDPHASTPAPHHLPLPPVSSPLLHPHLQQVPVVHQVPHATILVQSPHPCLIWEWQDVATRPSCQCAQTPVHPSILPELPMHPTQVKLQ